MKKIIVLFVFGLLSCGLNATPLKITNDSFNGVKPGNYAISSYLIYCEESILFSSGGSCPSPNWPVVFDFAPGATLTIPNGSYLYTSPFNGNSFCLGQKIDPSCNIKLGWYGQRVNSYYNTNWSLPSTPNYIFGLFSTHMGFPCGLPSTIPYGPPALIASYGPSFYELETNAMKITFNVYGTTLATLLYE